MKNVKPREVFGHYQILFDPLFKAYDLFVTSLEDTVEFEQEPISSRPVKPEVTFTQATEDNDWKFSMNLTYDFSENPNKEVVSDYFNNLTSDTIDPMPKKL